MTRVELETLIDKARRPHNRRMAVIVGIFFGVILVGLFSMPRGPTRPQVERWLLVVVGLRVVVGVRLIDEAWRSAS